MTFLPPRHRPRWLERPQRHRNVKRSRPTSVSDATSDCLEAKPMDRVRKIVLTAGLVAAMSGGAVALFAQGGPGRGAGPLGPGGPGGPGRFAAGFALGQLDLSDAQKQQVQNIMQRHREQSRTTMDRMQQAMLAQRSAINAVPVNEALVRSASANLAAVQADMAVEEVLVHTEILSTLRVGGVDRANNPS